MDSITEMAAVKAKLEELFDEYNATVEKNYLKR